MCCELSPSLTTVSRRLFKDLKNKEDVEMTGNKRASTRGASNAVEG